MKWKSFGDNKNFTEKKMFLKLVNSVCFLIENKRRCRVSARRDRLLVLFFPVVTLHNKHETVKNLSHEVWFTFFFLLLANNFEDFFRLLSHRNIFDNSL